MSIKSFLYVCLGLAASVSLYGCGGSADTAPKATPTSNVADDHDHEGESEAGHEHGEWWCNEHGVPEEICAQCETRIAADLKAKGDWCDEHDRPDSQCFICHPEKETEFAALYEAKYGKKPPKPSLEGGEHDHDHDHEHEEKG